MTTSLRRPSRPENSASCLTCRVSSSSFRQAGLDCHQDGPWKLIVTHGKTTRYELFNTKTDPQQKTNLADKLEQITFRLRGLTERKWAMEFKATMQKPSR